MSFKKLPLFLLWFFFFPLFYFWNKKNVRGKVTKAWLGVAGQLFLWLPTITPGDTQTVTACLFSVERMGRGERGGVEMLSLCFLWPLPDCTYCCGAGWKGKGPTAEKSCLPNRPIRSQLPNTLIDTIAAKGTSAYTFNICSVLISPVTG